MQRRSSNRFATLPLSLVALLGGACDDEGELSSQSQPVEVECLGADVATPAGAWLCPTPRTLACGETLPPLYVRDPSNPSCAAAAYDAVSVDPLRSGTHPVRVTRGDGSIACETTVTVTGASAPILTPKTLNLWPPNHKFHTISVADCVAVSDSCGSALRAEFAWASSDEPIDSIGDGHHAPDILFDGCDRVQVRAERQGPKDGRVYKLGVRVVDSAGNRSESACTIIIDHDKRGVVGADSGERYRIALDGQSGTPMCDGTPPPPPPPPPPPVDAGPGPMLL
jgi:hypothetical protein